MMGVHGLRRSCWKRCIVRAWHARSLCLTSAEPGSRARRVGSVPGRAGGVLRAQCRLRGTFAPSCARSARRGQVVRAVGHIPNGGAGHGCRWWRMSDVGDSRLSAERNPEPRTVGACAVSQVAILSVLHIAVGNMQSIDRVPAGGSGCVFGESAPRCAQPQGCFRKRCRAARSATGMAPAGGVNPESRTVGAEGRLPRGLWGRRARGTC